MPVPGELPPIALRRAVDADMLCRENPHDSFAVLGSFWPNSRADFESRIAKAFKECRPTDGFEPHITALCKFYASLILNAVDNMEFDWTVRVLGSSETKPEANRPQTLLEEIVSKQSHAFSITNLFFKSQSRPSMRNVAHLSGPDMLKSRIQYVSQDLFIKPAKLGGRALLIDDICNTGASMRVYTHALKAYASVEAVHCVNLAATRFHRGKDGYGNLKLDISAISDNPHMAQVWIDKSGIFHTRSDCPQIHQTSSCELRFIAQHKAMPCPACATEEKTPGKWWEAIFKRDGR